MKNLIGYILGFALCAYFMHDLAGHLDNCTCQDPMFHAGKMFAAALFILGSFSCACGIVVETFKLVCKLINPVK